MDQRRHRQDSTGSLAGPGGALGALVVTAVLTPVRDSWFGSTNAALILVVVIAAAASLGGRSAGALTAVVAGLSFNFFLTQPYYSLHIADNRDIATVVLLVLVGIVVGEFARYRQRTRELLRRESRSVGRLEHIATLLVSESTHEQLCDAVAEELVDQLGLASANWVDREGATGLAVLERNGWINATRHRYGRQGFVLPREGVELPVSFAGAWLGCFILTPDPDVELTPDDRRVAVALADLLASALARQSRNWHAP